jgi:hypothetical protein
VVAFVVQFGDGVNGVEGVSSDFVEVGFRGDRRASRSVQDRGHGVEEDFRRLHLARFHPRVVDVDFVTRIIYKKICFYTDSFIFMWYKRKLNFEKYRRQQRLFPAKQVYLYKYHVTVYIIIQSKWHRGRRWKFKFTLAARPLLIIP